MFVFLAKLVFILKWLLKSTRRTIYCVRKLYIFKSPLLNKVVVNSARTLKLTAERTNTLHSLIFFFLLPLMLRIKNLRIFLQPLEINFFSLRLHFTANQTKMVRSEPRNATCETQNVN